MQFCKPPAISIITHMHVKAVLVVQIEFGINAGRLWASCRRIHSANAGTSMMLTMSMQMFAGCLIVVTLAESMLIEGVSFAILCRVNKAWKHLRQYRRY
jgi:hypothetical protein